MGILAIAVIAVLLIAFIAGLAWLVVSLGSVAVKGGAGLRSPKGFASVAAGQGWDYTERDENLPRRLSPLLPETYDNTVALDVLRGQPEQREVVIFRYSSTDANSGGSLTVWAVRLPQSQPAFTLTDSTSASSEYARSLSRLTAAMNATDFTSWRIEGDYLQAWRVGGELGVPRLLAGAQSLMHAIDEVPLETWQKYGR